MQLQELELCEKAANTPEILAIEMTVLGITHVNCGSDFAKNPKTQILI